MASVLEVAEIVERMTDGFESAVLDYLEWNAAVAEDALREQIYSGQDGDGNLITPDYTDDPFFDDPANVRWYKRNDAYIAFKEKITPPKQSDMLLLPGRPVNVPNLYITGVFHSQIFGERSGDTFVTGVRGSGPGHDIITKYGDVVMRLGPAAVRYINTNILLPGIWRFFGECGY